MAQTTSLRLRGSTLQGRSADGTLQFNEEFGSGNAPGGNFSLSNGTGTGNATTIYKLSFSIASAGVQYVDLKDGTGTPKDVLNLALSLTTIKGIYLELDTPGSGNSIVWGPNGNASVANLPFSNGAFSNMSIHDKWLWTSTVGLTLSGGAANIALRNPSATTQTGELRIIGE